MYIGKKEQEQLTTLITRLCICIEKAVALEPGDGVKAFWLCMEARITVELAKKYGLVLPTYQVCLEDLAKHEKKLCCSTATPASSCRRNGSIA